MEVELSQYLISFITCVNFVILDLTRKGWVIFRKHVTSFFNMLAHDPMFIA